MVINERQIDIEIKDLDDLLNRFSDSMRSHSRRVAVCSAIIADYATTFINSCDIPSGTSLPMIAHLGGTCHDIGKLLLTDLELNGDGYLTHPSIGADLLEKHRRALLGSEPAAQMIIDIVRYHHSRKSEGIPLTAGICSIADRLDHLMTNKHLTGSDDMKVFKTLKEQAAKNYFDIVWVCTEQAWPCLTRRYIRWK